MLGHHSFAGLFLCEVVVLVQVCGLVQSGGGEQQAGNLPPAGVDIHQILAPAARHHASSLFGQSNWK